MYASAILDPSSVKTAADQLEQETVTELRATDDVAALLAATAPVVPTPTGSDLAALLRTAAVAVGRVRGTAVVDTADALRGMPVVAPGEPVAMINGPTAGWWLCVEVCTNERVLRSTAFALFRRDSGPVDPHVADRVWTRLIDGHMPDGAVTLMPQTHGELHQLAVDYAYAPYAAITGGPTGAPTVTLRLVVRVEP